MVGAKVRILHKVQLVYGIDNSASAKVQRLVRRELVRVMLHLQILQAHGVGGAFVQLVEVAAVKRYV